MGKFKFISTLMINAVALFFSFLFLSLFVISCANIGVESFSYFISKNKASDFGYSYLEVVSNNVNDSYSSFFDYADDYIGSEIKNHCDQFFFSSNNKTSSFFDVRFDNQIISTSALGYTTYNFSVFPMGLCTIDNKSVRDLNKNEIYISENLAYRFLGDDKDLSSLIGMNVTINNCEDNIDSLTIVNIISNVSLYRFTNNNMLDYDFLIYNYTCNRSLINNKKYCVFLNDDYLSSTYLIRNIENVINLLNNQGNEVSYRSIYYNFNNDFLIGKNQTIKENTILFFSSSRSLLCFISALLFLLFIFIFTYFQFCRTRISIWVDLLIILLTLLFAIALFRFIGGFLMNNVFIFVFNQLSIFTLIVFSLILCFCSIFFRWLSFKKEFNYIEISL